MTTKQIEETIPPHEHGEIVILDENPHSPTEEDFKELGFKERKKPGIAGADEAWTKLHDRVLIFHYKGVGQQEISRRVGRAHETIRKIINSKGFQLRLAALQKTTFDKILSTESEDLELKAILQEASEHLKKNSAMAARTLTRLAKSGEIKDRLKLDACKEILDRSGLPSEKKVDISHNYSPEEIESAKSTLLEVEAITARVTTRQSPFVLSTTRSQDVNTPAIETSVT